MLRRRRSASHVSFTVYWREAYVRGEIDLDEFERQVEWALRGERKWAPPKKVDTSPRAAAQRYSDAMARSVTNYTQGVTSTTNWIEAVQRISVDVPPLEVSPR